MDYSETIRGKITNKADIVEIIRQYVPLTQKGNDYVGLCPFHKDNHPSMHVSPKKHCFNCFSCGAKGDVITFISKFKNISTTEALKEIGKTVGIEVQLSKKEQEYNKNIKYYNVLKESLDFFKFYLYNTTDGKKGLEYLYNDRMLSDDDIKRFNIGLTGDDDILFKTLNSKNILPIDMISVGIVNSFSDTYHDIYKNRIMFPIEDLDGHVIGFSGRKYLKDDKSDSKYINTKETILFKKSDILYNYFEAKEEIKEKNVVYLFEGFMDVIASVRSNVLNAVASMGTALTDNQIKALKKLTNNIIVCYDSDGPGTMATIKAIQLLIKNDCNVSVVRIKDGKDPDEFLKANGKEALHNALVNDVVSSIDFLIDYEKKSCTFSNVNEIEEFKNKIFDYLKLYKSNLIIEKSLQKLSKILDVSVENLSNDFNNIKTNVISNYVPEFKENNNSNNIDKKLNAIKSKYLKAERKLIKAAFYNQKQCLEIESRLANNFFDSNNRNILYKLMNYYKKFDVMDKDSFFELELNEQEKEILNSIISNEDTPKNEEILSLIEMVKKWPYEKYINDISNKANKTEEDLKNIVNYKKKLTNMKGLK